MCGTCFDKKGNRVPLRYCGDNLECLGVEKGDSYPTVLSKINNSVCKDNVYLEVTTPVDIASVTSPNVYKYPVGYEALYYINTSTVKRTYLVTVSYDITVTRLAGVTQQNYVDGAIIKTNVTSSDTVEYESLGNFEIALSATTFNIPQNKSFFKKVELLSGEKISLKFKTPRTTANAYINKAQFFVQEL